MDLWLFAHVRQGRVNGTTMISMDKFDYSETCL